MRRPSSLPFGMTGLSFALFANGLFLLGTYDSHAAAETVSSLKAVAVTGTLIGAFALLFHAIYLVVGAPLGTDSLSLRIQMLFSSVAGMYGFQLTGLFIIQVTGHDLKVFGDVCLFNVVLGLIQMAIFSAYAREGGMSWSHHICNQYVLGSWVALSLGVWATTHGYLNAWVTGVIAFASLLGTWYFLVFTGGLLTPPGEGKKAPTVVLSETATMDGAKRLEGTAAQV